MENRKRNIQMKFYVTEEEKRLIDEKMKQLPIKQYGAYFRKMAIRRDEGGDGGKTLEIRGKQRLSARDEGANYQQS